MKKITSLLLLIMMLLSYGCQTDDYGIGGNKSSQNGFTLNYKVSGVVAAKTKATVPSEEGEENLHSLYLLIFEYSTNGSGQFLYAKDLSEDGQTMGTVGTINLEFDSQSGISNSENYVLLFLANADEFVDESNMDSFIESLEGLTENDVIQLYSYWATEGVGGYANPNEQEIYTSSIINVEALPMSARQVKQSDEQSVSIELIRNVCRFDIRNQATDYTLVSASIWNAYPEISIWDRPFFTYEQERVRRFYGVYAENNRVNGGLYAFENYVNVPEQDDKLTTCLILGFKSHQDGEVYYYRANINSSYLGQQLKKNNVYTTTITTVYGKGANCEKDAWEESDFLLDLDINGWDVDHNGSIQYDGENILAVPVSKVNFTYTAESRELSIFTLGTGTLEISKESLFSGLSVSLNNNILTISVQNSEVDQSGYVEVKFGNLRSTITITQSGSSTERLDLSREKLAPFSSTKFETYIEPITVTSSGSWTAEIYNGDNYFSLATAAAAVTIQRGNSGDTFQIHAIENNPDPSPRYAFVLITLDDNPEISRVLVLMQKGIGGVDLDHPAKMMFTADGQPEGYPLNHPTLYYDVIVTASDGDEPLTWEVSEVLGAGNFNYEKQLDDKTIRITASNNTSNSTLSTTFRVRIPETGAYKDFVVSQAVHTITTVPSVIPPVTKAGGSAEIVVNSSANWSATVESTNDLAYFNEQEGLTTITGANGGVIKVTFPKLTTPGITPVATITLVIPGTAVAHTFTVQQEALMPNGFTFVSYDNAEGSIATGNAYIGRMTEYMKTSSWYGSGGIVYMPNSYSFATNNTVSNDMRIYQITNASVGSGRYNNIIQWWSQPDKILVYGTRTSRTYNENILKSKSSVFAFRDGSARSGVVRPFTTTSNSITEYMLNTGPFSPEGTTLSGSNLEFKCNRASRVLTNWPATFTPLLMHPDGGCVVGIDPTLRLIYIGNPSLFGTNGYTQTSWNNPNQVFLKNFIAFMTNAAMYGDEFLNDFK